MSIQSLSHTRRRGTYARIGLFTLLLLLLAVAPHAPQSARAVANFPEFQFERVIISPDTPGIQYNPTGEFIFPSIIRAADYFSNPLGDYYLYYAPHDPPGAIALAYADSPEGPWTEYANNPIIDRVWSPHYSVSHVSSPHAIWNSSENKLFLYFHGENSATRLATSTDGITFTYEKVVVSTANIPTATETSYARVFKYTIPSKNNTYIMLFMVNFPDDRRRLHLAWSNNGRDWTVQTQPLISPNAEEGQNLSAPWYFPWNGGHYVVYIASSGNMHVTDVGANFDQEQHLGVFFDDPGKRAAAPAFLQEGNTLYMFFERGPRLEARIALAKAYLGATVQRDVVTLQSSASSGITRTGTWTTSTENAQLFGTSYIHDGNTAKGQKSVRFTPNLPSAGRYDVQVWWSAHPNRATNVPIDIVHSQGTTTATVNQEQNGGRWNSIGVYQFGAGTAGSVLIRTTGTNDYVIADAVRFVRTEVIVDNTNSDSLTLNGNWTVSSENAQRFGANYLHDGNTGKGAKSIVYRPTIPTTGDYDVYAWWSAHPNRATNVPIDVAHSQGTATVTVNQELNGGQWNLIGRYRFVAGVPASVTIRNVGTNDHVIADAIRLVRAAP